MHTVAQIERKRDLFLATDKNIIYAYPKKGKDKLDKEQTNAMVIYVMNLLTSICSYYQF